MAANDMTDDPRATRKEEKLEQLRPTLFIGVGGTGMEVMLRVRRHILNALWGTPPNRLRVESLADFPLAQFINFDLDTGATTATDESQRTDLMHELVKFTEEERIAEPFDIEKYSKDDDALGRFPHIQAWSPLTPQRIRGLGIDPSKGAGQIRAISRLYFFDKYVRVRDQIRLKLLKLKSGLSKEDQYKRLGLELAQDKFRVVVIGSVAGGTGAGTFLDMGWLAGWIARSAVPAAEVELMLFMPSGFQRNNKDRTEANGYAALMELETAMRGGAQERYITRWDAYDRPSLSTRPYDEVYLIDAGNVAGLHTSEVKHIFEMVADALFENYASADFANRKRSVAVNQRLHKLAPLLPPVTRERFGDMKLSYYKGYSAFGQAVLDTQQEARLDIRAHVWAGAMLKAFFGVAGGEAGANRATDKQRDAFMSDFMLLSQVPFTDFPTFSSRQVELTRSSGEFADYLVVEELLKDRHGSLLANVQQKVDNQVEAIKSGYTRESWGAQIRDLVKVLERDAIRNQEVVAETIEDRVRHRREELFDQLFALLRDQMFAYLDNKQFGGLTYVLSLVNHVKDRLSNASTGIIAHLNQNAARYAEIKDAIRTHEYERLMSNLAQIRGGWINDGDRQSAVVVDQLKLEIANYIKFHLRAKAATEAAQLMTDLTTMLGERSGVDAQGEATWTGWVGQLQTGREAVNSMLDSLERSVSALQRDLKHEHATYIFIETQEQELVLPPAQQLREWADEAFKDIGGSRAVFRMLTDATSRATLLSKVKRMAERRIMQGSSPAATAESLDPLMRALEAMSATERRRRFSELLARAMPWVDANLQAEYTPVADQFRCFVGVSNAAAFEHQYRAEIDTCVPTNAGISPAQVAIVETGVPGRAVCYCELSGIPLTVLRGLDAWRTSYRKESANVPVHTHVDSTQFAHPLVPTMGELNQLADDFKVFLEAVMLGVLRRSTQRNLVHAGNYELEIARGDVLKVGSERAFRQDVLPLAFRDAIATRVSDRLYDLGAVQLLALCELAKHYANDVYATRKQPDEKGRDHEVRGFASVVASTAATELRQKALTLGATDALVARVSDRFRQHLGEWTTPVPGSDTDAYEWEVREVAPGSPPRLKLVVTAAFFDGDRMKALFEPPSAAVPPIPGPAGFGGAFVQPPPLPLAAQYWFGLEQGPSGPFDPAQVRQLAAEGRLNEGTLAWTPGWADWQPLRTAPELVALLRAAPPAVVPPRFPGSGR